MLKENYRILLGEPDKSICAVMESLFSKEGFVVYTAFTGTEVVEKATRHLPHIILLEVALPQVDGIEICYELRNHNLIRNSIIAFYTAQSEDYSQVAGLGAGADDYIIKPLRNSVLLMRIKALLRRLQTAAESHSPASGLTIDRERYLVTMNGTDIVLPRKEFELLSLLHSSPRKVFTRDEIARLIWGYEIESRNRTIDVHVRKLREKLGDRYIKTVKGIGYSLEI